LFIRRLVKTRAAQKVPQRSNGNRFHGGRTAGAALVHAFPAKFLFALDRFLANPGEAVVREQRSAIREGRMIEGVIGAISILQFLQADTGHFVYSQKNFV
jgi:hypothetical protein